MNNTNMRFLQLSIKCLVMMRETFPRKISMCIHVAPLEGCVCRLSKPQRSNAQQKKHSPFLWFVGVVGMLSSILFKGALFEEVKPKIYRLEQEDSNIP